MTFCGVGVLLYTPPLVNLSTLTLTLTNANPENRNSGWLIWLTKAVSADLTLTFKQFLVSDRRYNYLSEITYTRLFIPNEYSSLTLGVKPSFILQHIKHDLVMNDVYHI